MDGPTFLRASRCSAFSARSFSWLLRFLSRVSGTRIWSWVGTLLLDQSVDPLETIVAMVPGEELRHSVCWRSCILRKARIAICLEAGAMVEQLPMARKCRR